LAVHDAFLPPQNLVDYHQNDTKAKDAIFVYGFHYHLQTI